LIARKVTLLQKKNLNVIHIQRSNWEGFKAGALKYGLTMAKGEYIAVFDADFFLPAIF
jgi:cellulose synthase/poly-beta-1,6-N-acetylglucosamine synthase-like glycosyltransferase